VTILPPRLAGLLAMGFGKLSRHPGAHANGQRADDARKHRRCSPPAHARVQGMWSSQRA